MFLIFSLLLCTFGHRYVDAQGQRVAPGVPPQHYQQQYDGGQQMHQQVPQQQVHQQQQIHQQQQQFQQQIPVQQVPQQQQQFQQAQQQQPPMQQQVPIKQIYQQGGHDHDHGHARNPQQLLNTVNLEHEKAHIAEHMPVPIDTSKMTDQELQFHYFKMHDNDNNNKLDGCELIKSLIHWHAEQGNNDPNGENNANKLFTDEELVSLIDPILEMDDVNRDGFIDYPEFIQAQQKAAATGRE